MTDQSSHTDRRVKPKTTAEMGKEFGNGNWKKKQKESTQCLVLNAEKHTNCCFYMSSNIPEQCFFFETDV